MSRMPDVIESFGFPITLAFSPDTGRIFFSERITGNLWEIDGDDFILIRSFPILMITGHHETGLLGIAIDPEFESNGFIYCFYTYGNSLKDAKNKIVRVNANQRDEEEVLLDDIPAGDIHNGGIIAFAPDGTLFAGVGVHNDVKQKAQDIGYLGGKVLRIQKDGSVPEDNPFDGSPVYSYGHRNIFGLAFHPISQRIYICEEGPDENDEINVIEKGGNYGWPDVTGVSDKSQFIDPIWTYTPTITPTQCCFAGNSLIFGSFNEGTVHQLVLDEKDTRKAVKDIIIYQGKSFGVVGVFYSPDGEFYVTTPNRIAKFTPKES